MWKLTRKGLVANRLRFLLTGVAVVLGVAFVSGTLVLTATIQKTFDDLWHYPQTQPLEAFLAARPEAATHADESQTA